MDEATPQTWLALSSALGLGLLIGLVRERSPGRAHGIADQVVYSTRIEATINSILVNSENLQAARSRVLDTDYAATTTELARTQIIQQAAQSVLAQANQRPQAVLSLLN